MEKLIIVGCGAGGVFTALETLELNKDIKILMIDKGNDITKRVCPKELKGVCTNCKSCSINSGFGGSGSSTDSKMALSSDIGGDVGELIGKDVAEDIVQYVWEIYQKFGAKARVEGVSDREAINSIRKKAIKSNLKLIEAPLVHLGTEGSREIYKRFKDYLVDNGVEILCNTNVADLVVEDGTVRGVIDDENNVYNADKVVLALGRQGASFIKDMCNKYGIKNENGRIDIGVRVECRDEVMKEVNDALYEAKLVGYPPTFKDSCRVFCANPSGFVARENYRDIGVVNGHAYKSKKSNNTNFAILCSYKFTEPFEDTILYGDSIAKLSNMLGEGEILVQRYGDIISGKRSKQKDLEKGNVKPTLKAVAGDITLALPYRVVVNILEFIDMLDGVVDGIKSDETLLYATELKRYSNKINVDDSFETSIKNLHAIGDCSGWSRNLMMASVSGIYLARKIILKKY